MQTIKRITLLIKSRTKELTDKTGIFGDDQLLQGFEWSRIKSNAMKLGASSNQLIVSLHLSKNVVKN